jgi:hypothetical protein
MIAVEWKLPIESSDTVTCHLWAILRLLAFYGFDAPAPLYGCTCTFAADLSGRLPAIASWPPDWAEGAARIFGMRLQEVDRDDFDCGWREVVGRIGAGQPTIIVANVHDLPHHFNYGHASYGHCLIVTGYDEGKGEAHLVDDGPARWRGTIPLGQLRLACDLRGLPNGGTSRLRYFDFSPPTRPVSADAVDAAAAAEAFLSVERGVAGTDPLYARHPAHRDRGSAGIRAYAEALRRLGALIAHEGPDDALKAHLAGLHLASSAVGELRLGCQGFILSLVESGRLAGAEAEARAAVADLGESYRLWRMVSMMYLKARIGDPVNIMDRTARRLGEIAGLEERAAGHMPRLRAAVR